MLRFRESTQPGTLWGRCTPPVWDPCLPQPLHHRLQTDLTPPSCFMCKTHSECCLRTSTLYGPLLGTPGPFIATKKCSRGLLSVAKIGPPGHFYPRSWQTMCAHAYNIWKWHPTQRTANAVNNFIDQGGFWAMKTLSGRIAPRCAKHQFCDKMTASSWSVFELSLFEQSGCNEERKRKMALLCLAVFCVAVEQLYESYWS